MGTVIPSNPSVGNSIPTCTFYPEMNGHLCDGLGFSVLTFQNVASDFNTRIMWPVVVSSPAINFSNVINGWREWDWIGSEPQNKRLGRFWSLVVVNNTYTLNYTALPPASTEFALQKKSLTGEPNEYVIARVVYSVPNTVQIQRENGQIVPSAKLQPDGTLEDLNTSQCGSNQYFY